MILIHRRDELRAEKIAQERLFNNPKIKILWNTTVSEIMGDDAPSVTGLRLWNVRDQKEILLDVEGVFIAIGHKPNTEMFKGEIELDNDMYIVTRPSSTLTNVPGVFAAGDVQDKVYRQAVTAAGTGCMAALDALNYITDNHIK